MERVEVTCQTTERDYINAVVWEITRKPGYTLWVLFLVLFTPAVCFFIAILLWWDEFGWLIPSLIVLFGVSWLIGYPFLRGADLRYTVRKRLRKRGIALVCGPRQLMLTEDAYTERTEKAEATIRWEDVTTVKDADDFLVIHADVPDVHIGETSTFPSEADSFLFRETVGVIPRVGFADPANYERVRDFALARMETAD